MPSKDMKQIVIFVPKATIKKIKKLMGKKKKELTEKEKKKIHEEMMVE